MASGGQGQEDARAAANMQQQLFNSYRITGLPALGGAINYARGALGANGAQVGANYQLPAYVQNAYNQAKTGALESNVASLGALRSQIGSRLDPSVYGGAALGAQGTVAQTAGQSLMREATGIRASQAMNTIDERNKLLGIMAGGAASGTNLSASFGALGNQAIALEPRDQTFGLVTGGLSAGLGLYSQLAQRATAQQNPWAPVYTGMGYSPGQAQALGGLTTMPAGGL